MKNTSRDRYPRTRAILRRKVREQVLAWAREHGRLPGPDEMPGWTEEQIVRLAEEGQE